MDENQKIIYDLLKEMRADQKEQIRQLSSHGEELIHQKTSIEKIQSDSSEMKSDVRDLKDNMAEHMRRTDGVEQMVVILQELHTDNQKRIEELEEDSKKKDEIIRELKTTNLVNTRVKTWIKDNIKWFVTIVATLVGIATKIIGLW